MSAFSSRLWATVRDAFHPALRTAWWLLKMMIPITLTVSVLNYLGVIAIISDWLSPMFGLLGLTGEAALVFVTSILANIYSAIAVMAGLNLDLRSVTILGTMCLIAHNLIIETAIQRKAGASTAFIVILRIGSALIAGMLLNLVIPKDLNGALFFDSVGANPQTWAEVFTAWGKTILGLITKMVPLIIGLNVLQNLLREFKIIDFLIIPLKPLMKVLGLPYATSFLWIVANMIGLAYGGAAMITEIEKGDVSKEDVDLLNTHIALNHSMLEDTTLFAVLGVGLGWLLFPRLILAVIAVWMRRFYMQYAVFFRRWFKFSLLDRR